MNRLATTILVFGALAAAAPAADLSKYRSFQLGTDMATAAKQASTDPSHAKVIHSRPALIQELAWNPQPLGASSRTEAAKEVVLSFYNGELYRIAVDYDRYQTEGLTAEDLIEVISGTYGDPTRPTAPMKALPGSYSGQDEVVAVWQDTEYRFDLTRSTYGSTFSLIGVLKRLEAPVQAAIAESKRLDDQEAPQREAERVSKDHDAEQARLEKLRLVNKPKFRP